MKSTKIECCDSTLNPVVGCTYGCPYCYARKMNKRFKWTDDFSKPQFFPERLEQLKSKKPKTIFMNSMSDIADWEEHWIEQTFKAMNENKQHNYLFLTKRPERLEEILEPRYTPPNWWFGVTLTDKHIPISFTTHPTVKTFISIEPILTDFDNEVLIADWIIIGAETGNRKGKIIPKKEWIENIVEMCKEVNTSVFMKNSLMPIVGEENMLREFPEGLGR